MCTEVLSVTGSDAVGCRKMYIAQSHVLGRAVLILGHLYRRPGMFCMSVDLRADCDVIGLHNC